MQCNSNFHRLMKGTVLTVFTVCSLLLTACNKKPQAPSAPPPPPEVSVITVHTQKLVLTTELPGRTSALRVAEIRPQVNGVIRKRLFTEGSDIKAGQILYEIDPAPFQAALDNAEANLNAAQAAANRSRAALNASMASIARQNSILKLARVNSKRFDELLADKAVSVLQRDQSASEAEVAEAGLKAAEAQAESDRKAIAAAEAVIKQAEAALRSAQINMGYTKITAPISGRIGKSNISEGALVIAYQPLPLAVIQQLDEIYVDVSQSTTELLRLKNRLAAGSLTQNGSDQNQVSLILEDGSIFSQKGALQFRDVTVDPTTGSVTLRIVFPNPDSVLLPGMYVRAIVQEGVNDQAILIPQQSVARDPKGNPTALIIGADNKVEQARLTLDRSIEDKWFVTSGVKPGDRIIVEGLQRVRPGAAVRIAQPADNRQNPDNSPAASK